MHQVSVRVGGYSTSAKCENVHPIHGYEALGNFPCLSKEGVAQVNRSRVWRADTQVARGKIKRRQSFVALTIRCSTAQVDGRLPTIPCRFCKVNYFKFNFVNQILQNLDFKHKFSCERKLVWINLLLVFF